MKEKRHIEVNGQTLEIELYYHLGGMNYFTGRNEKRGYYLSVSPVKLSKSEDGRFVTTSYTAFSGVKDCILEVKRSSEKAFNQARELAKEKEQVLIDHVTKSNSIA